MAFHRSLTRRQIIALELVPVVLLTVCIELGLRASLYRHLGHDSIVAGSLPNLMAALLTTLALGFIKAEDTKQGPSKSASISILALSGYEFAQLVIPGRTFDAMDLLATVIGAGIAFSLLRLAYRFNA